MARMLKPLRGIDEAGAGGFFGELADAYLGYKKLEQGETLVEQGQESIDIKREQLQATIESEKIKLQHELSLKGVETFGADVFKMTDKGIEFKDDFYIPAINPITNAPIYDISEDQQAEVDAKLALAREPYSKMTPGSYDVTELQKAESGVYRGMGISPREVQNPAYAGAKFEQTEGGMWQPIPLTERSQELGGKISREVYAAKSDADKFATFEIAEQASDLKREEMVLGGEISENQIRVTAELKEASELRGFDFKREFLMMEQKWGEHMADKKNTFTAMLAEKEYSWQDALNDKGYKHKELMADINQTHLKEINELGYAHAKDMLKDQFDNAWEMGQFLENHKMGRLKFQTEAAQDAWDKSNQAALDKSKDDKEWYLTVEKYKEKLRINAEDRKKYDGARIALASAPQLVKPLATGKFTDSWERGGVLFMGFDEGDWLEEGLEQQFLGPARGLIDALTKIASMTDVDGNVIVDPQIEQLILNIDKLQEIMGDPDGTTEGIYKVNFYNEYDWDAGKARSAYTELSTLKQTLLTAMGK